MRNLTIACIAALVIWTGVGVAQQGRGIVFGAVTDSSGAAMPDVKVSIVNVATKGAVTTQTNSEGNYTSPPLVVGDYEVSVEQAGFKRQVRAGIGLQVDQRAQINFQMEVGAVGESVQVTAEAPLVDTGTGTNGAIVERRRIEDLPVNGRSAFDLVQLAPGVRNQFGAVASSFVNRWSTMMALSINGGPIGVNGFFIDGTYAVDPYLQTTNVTTTVDAIQEFKVQSGTMSAEYGTTLGGIVNIATRSGTNQYHGSAYEFLRNDALDANSWSNNRSSQGKSPLRYHQFGATFGGPVRLPKMLGPLHYDGRERTFFFLNYEGYRYKLSSTGLYSLPTEAMRGGDFSQLKDGACRTVTLYDPATTQPDPARSGFYIRSPFAGNTIPAGRFDPAARKLLHFYPVPNRASSNACTNTNNYYGAQAEKRRMNQVTYRLDHRFSSKNSFFFRHTLFRQWRDNGGSNLYPDPLVRARYDPAQGNNLTLYDVHSFNPAVINEVRVGLTRQIYLFTVASYGQNFPAKLGLPATVPSDSCPGISAGLPSFQCGTIGKRGGLIWQLFDAVTLNRGAHTIKTGIDFWLTQANSFQETSPSGQFNFTAALTANPDPGYTLPAGNAFASLLLGQVASASATTHLGQAQVSKSYSAFIQDDWKVSRRLTLNLGLRYMLQEPPFERNNGASRFTLAANPLTGLPGRTEYMGKDFERAFATRKTDFAPRFGFAYDPFGTQRTVLRGGYSIYYSYAFSNYTDSFADTNGFANTTTSYNAANSAFAAFIFSQGLPSYPVSPQGANLGPNLAFTSQNFRVSQTDSKTPMSQQWSFSIQQQLPASTVLDLAYSGNHGVHLISDTYNLNQIDPKNYSLGTQLLQQLPNPYAGKVPGSQGNATVSRQQTLLPYPHLGGVAVRVPHLGNSIYHALMARVQKRYSMGLVLLGSYTFGKQISDSISAVAAQAAVLPGNFSLGYQNSGYDRRAERGIDASNIMHRFVLSATYELPFGKARNRFVRAVAGGWQWNTILTLSSGLPIAIRGANNNVANRPDYVRNPALPDNYVDPNPASGVLWFDPTAFVNPALWTFGNAPKTLPDFFGPGVVNLDTSLFKTFHLAESVRLQFRAEAFNAMNHVNLELPNSSFSTSLGGVLNTGSQFGRITSAGDPRRVQLALKLTF